MNNVTTDAALDEVPAHILGAVARGWCTPANAGKVMDSDLALAIAREVSALVQQAPIQSAGAAPAEKMETDEAREFLIGFMNEHFTDRTFHRYIRGQREDGKPTVNLAGDFAWQMATALRRIGAAPCAMCHGTGSVGRAPDDYFDCPDCTALAVPATAPTEQEQAQTALRIKIDYRAPFGDRGFMEVIAEEFTIPCVTGHRFAVHNSVDIPGEYVATHVETGFAVARGETPEFAIELARNNWTKCTPESLALKLIRAKNQTKVPKPNLSGEPARKEG